MPTRQQMKDLGQDIIGAHEDRTRRISQVQDDVKALRKDVNSVLEGYGREVLQMHAARAAVSKELRDELAKSAANLGQDVKVMLKEDDEELKGIRAARAASAKRLHTDLVKGTVDIKQNVDAMRHGFGQTLKDIHISRVTGGKQNRAQLAKSAANLRQDVGTMLEGFDAVREEVRSTLAGGRDEWQKLAVAMQTKRGATAVEAKPQRESLTEAAAPKAKTVGVKTSLAAVSARVFECLANHPDGTRLTELARELGLARIQVSRAIHGLMEEIKVEKRGSLYFAV